MICIFFFFNDTATTEIYTLSLHDALPISIIEDITLSVCDYVENKGIKLIFDTDIEEKYTYCDIEKIERIRSEEHTSELQSRQYLVCRLLLEKKKKNILIYLNTYNNI